MSNSTGGRGAARVRARAGRRVEVVAVAMFLALTVSACTSDTGRAGHVAPARHRSTRITERTSRPTGPAATIAGPITGGKGVFLAVATPAEPTLKKAGYTEAEYTATGTATSYTAGDLPTDGRFTLQPGPTADYVTRILVRRPAQASKFNGTVLVEWLNVSSGLDSAPDYTYLQDELLREGYAWVGVSAQLIGVEGGPVVVAAPGADAAGAGTGLRAIDPARYGSLHHPGDAYSYDMYTQVARALRDPGATDALGGLRPKELMAVGESQSAFTLTTYYDGVQPLTREFDGFFIHSRGAAPAPLSSPSGYIDIAGSLTGHPTQLRTDLATPVFMIETETDLLGLIGYYPARQPDNPHLRLWEVAGTAHADAVQVGGREASMGCPTPINRGQQVFVLRAALQHLQRWVVDGTPPPHGNPLEVDTSSGTPTFVHDDVGNVKGGVRTPVVDAPVDVLSGLVPSDTSLVCLLLGSTTPIPADRLAAMYPSRQAYVRRYTTATGAAIEQGFALAADRSQMLDGADPSRIPG